MATVRGSMPSSKGLPKPMPPAKPAAQRSAKPGAAKPRPMKPIVPRTSTKPSDRPMAGKGKLPGIPKVPSIPAIAPKAAGKALNPAYRRPSTGMK